MLRRSLLQAHSGICLPTIPKHLFPCHSPGEHAPHHRQPLKAAYHRIIDWFGLERTSEIIWLHAPVSQDLGPSVHVRATAALVATESHELRAALPCTKNRPDTGQSSKQTEVCDGPGQLSEAEYVNLHILMCSGCLLFFFSIPVPVHACSQNVAVQGAVTLNTTLRSL